MSFTFFFRAQGQTLANVKTRIQTSANINIHLSSINQRSTVTSSQQQRVEPNVDADQKGMANPNNPYGYDWDASRHFRDGTPWDMNWTAPDSDPRYFGYGHNHPVVGDGMGDWGFGDPDEVDYRDLFPGAYHGMTSKHGVV